MAGKDSKGVGDPKGKVEARVLIIEARYYDEVGDALMQGAVAELEARGATYDVVSVPGALEIPQVLAQAAGKMLVGGDVGDGLYDGVVALGCVVRGETSHYDIVCNNANHWLMETVTKFDVPFGNAILTVDTKEQALARAKGGRKGKGADAVRACLRMVEVSRQFDELGADILLREIELDDLEFDAIEIEEAEVKDIFGGNGSGDKPPKGRPS